MKNGIIKVKRKEIPCLIAETAEEKQKGLMFVKGTPPNMVFPFHTKCINAFWMKNTFVPLDIIFCLGGKIVAIEKGEPHSTKTVGNCMSDMVVEFPMGTCESWGVQVGDDIAVG